MNKTRLLAAAALALTGVLGVGAAQAADVSWTVTIGSNGPVFPAPAIIRPAPVLVPVVRPTPVVYPAPVRVPVYDHHRGYRQPTRWDRDGDGILNRHDRLYNPVWDRDGDGIPNRHDRHDRRRY
jgi:hypothetical protein